MLVKRLQKGSQAAPDVDFWSILDEFGNLFSSSSAVNIEFLDSAYAVYAIYAIYTIYAVHVIYAVHAVYAVYAAYAVYAIHVIYAIYAVYTIYVVYAIYAIYAVYAVTQKVQMYFLSDGRCSLMAPSIGNMHLMSFGFLLQLYTYCIYAV